MTVPRFTYSRLAYDPWYFGGNFGFYNSWNYGFGYGYGRRIWGYPYSYWYDPFAYMPYAYYDPYVPYSYGGSAYRGRQDRDDARPTGSLRLRANPKHAKVYIDGALVGTVDDFDGLTGHLTIDAGAHQLELRADGYESFSTEISLPAGRTTTERAHLKKRP